MEANNKFFKFVKNIEEAKNLTNNMESILLSNTIDQNRGSGTINRTCSNSGSSCDGSINKRTCTNSSDCSNSANSRTCLPQILEPAS